MEITCIRGDLTTQDVDAIVNAANSMMLGGGGVDGAIHRAAGRDLVEACRRFPRKHGIRCPPGEARITPGFDLPARHLIHTVGPIFRNDPDPAATLARAHRSALALAVENGLRTVAFPAISCGAYGYPHDQAADVAIRTVREHGQALDEVRFVLFGQAIYETFSSRRSSTER
ncbi:MAG: O-acetyl-ADP-ribose deacetylase [Proteobacteria bacterium]|nr:O-acetyl-ADP-ribose deacetylase [Pseudomonadota bacterium]MCP4918636.1 O-acetyl-ADP-ribose deacetylase [Pseudomonadota bacterium]